MAQIANFATSLNGENTRGWRGEGNFARRQDGSVALNWHKTAGTRERTAACHVRREHGSVALKMRKEKSVTQGHKGTQAQRKREKGR